ncbi:MAG: hypothetical protein E7261_02635 [Lachnospiraceae bacterium]|nr:hypothetical protein [Lachnospiraceae bacterium]
MKIKKHNIFLLLFIISYVAVLPIVFTEMYKNSGFGELFAAPDDNETTDALEVIDGGEENPGDITETPPVSTSEAPSEFPTSTSDVTNDSSTEPDSSETTPEQETTPAESETDPTTETSPEETQSNNFEESVDTTTADTPAEVQTETSTEESSEVSTTPQESTTNQEETSEQETTAEDDTKVQFMTVEPAYFDDALFIGDSRTVGIYEYGVLKDADFFCNVGMSVFSVHKAEVNIPSVGKTTLTKLLENCKYGKVYIMLGMNELGYSLNKIIGKYEELINEVRTLQPDAIIYLQANLRVTKKRSESDSIYNNTKINRINSAVAAYANDKDIFYIDVNPLFDDGEGNFDKKYTNDNTHPFARYYTEWSKWLCEMAVIR